MAATLASSHSPSLNAIKLLLKSPSRTFLGLFDETVMRTAAGARCEAGSDETLISQCLMRPEFMGILSGFHFQIKKNKNAQSDHRFLSQRTNKESLCDWKSIRNIVC